MERAGKENLKWPVEEVAVLTTEPTGRRSAAQCFNNLIIVMPCRELWFRIDTDENTERIPFMILTRKYAALVLTIAVSLAIFGSANANAWEFSKGEEDWGPSCFVTHTHSDGDLTLMSTEGNFNAVVLISLSSYPEDTQNVSVLFEVDEDEEIVLTGSVDDYFGVISLKISRENIEAMAAGKNLNILVAGGPLIPVSLDGSGAAINSFLSCSQTR